MHGKEAGKASILFTKENLSMLTFQHLKDLIFEIMILCNYTKKAQRRGCFLESPRFKSDSYLILLLLNSIHLYKLVLEPHPPGYFDYLPFQCLTRDSVKLNSRKILERQEIKLVHVRISKDSEERAHRTATGHLLSHL